MTIPVKKTSLIEEHPIIQPKLSQQIAVDDKDLIDQLVIEEHRKFKKKKEKIKHKSSNTISPEKNKKKAELDTVPVIKSVANEKPEREKDIQITENKKKPIHHLMKNTVKKH